ncbi:MAG: hypothetical protein FVQ79_08470 [Planctomycetes bacterium]|nr:hypothetical protein [Planctomycetota bacterium]
MIDHKKDYNDLPQTAVDFIDSVIKRVRYRKKVRLEVRDELIDHFTMALSECNTPEQKEAAVKEMIEKFGDIKTLACLIRRGKKRCRPLWKKIIIRTFQGIGIFILCFILYAVWFFTGDANPTIDYLEAFNERVRPKIVDEDNAWPYYEKGMNLLVEAEEELKDLLPQIGRYGIMRGDVLNVQDQIAVTAWIDKNEMAWQGFSKAVQKPYCYRKYNYGHPDDKWLLSVMLPHISKLRQIARLGMSRCKQALEGGNTDIALRDSITLAKSSRHWQGRKTLIEALVGMAVGSYGCQGILNVAASDTVTSVQLKEMYNELSTVYSTGYPPIELEGEKTILMDVIQHCFTDGGPGGGHLVPRELSMVMDSDDLEEELLVLSGALVHAGRDDVVAKANEAYNKFEKLSKMSPFERQKVESGFEDVRLELPEYRYFLLRSMLPKLGRVTDLRYEHKALYDAALTVLAARRWQLEKGVLPVDLNELVEAGYLDRVPDDPYSDGPLVYRVDGDGFVLYSAGRNFTDDGGIAGTDTKDHNKPWGETGDAVFWPVR